MYNNSTHEQNQGNEKGWKVQKVENVNACSDVYTPTEHEFVGVILALFTLCTILLWLLQLSLKLYLCKAEKQMHWG